MFQNILLGGLIFLALESNLKALDEIDSFVLNRCAARCNGESTDCRDCYSEAVDLFDQPQSMSKKDLDINPNGGFEISF